MKRAASAVWQGSLKTGKGALTASQLVLQAKIPGIDAAKFADIAAKAKAGCPISRLLNAKVTLAATLL